MNDDAAKNNEMPEIERPRFFSMLLVSGLLQPLTGHMRKKSKLLISHKVQGAANIKNMKLDKLKKMIVGMPDQTYSMIVEDWVSKETTAALEKYLSDEARNENTLKENLLSLRLDELGIIKLPDDERKEFCKLYLACHFSPDRASLVSWLQAVIKTSSNGKDDSDQTQYLAELVDNPALVLERKAPSGDNTLFLLLACAIAIRLQEKQAAESLMARVKETKTVKETEGLIETIKKHFDKTMPHGLVPAKRLAYAMPGEFTSLHDLEVLTRCTNQDYDKQFSFSKVLAVKRTDSREWKELDDLEAEQLFPPSGDIIHFFGASYPELPAQNKYAVWRVEEHPVYNDEDRQKVSRHATKLVCPVQQVRSMEGVMPNDVDSIIDGFKVLRNDLDFYGIDNSVIHLADDSFIKAIDINKIENEEQLLIEAWKKLDVIQLKNGLNLHVGELPDTSRLIDLRYPEEVVLASLEQLQAQKVQVSAKLRSWLESLADVPETSQLLEDMQLDQLQWQDDQMQAMARELLARPEIKERIDAAIEREVAAATGNGANGNGKPDGSSIELKIEQTKQTIDKRLHELANLDDDINTVLEKHFENISKIGKRLRDVNFVRRNCYQSIDSSASDFNQLVAKLESKSRDMKMKSNGKGQDENRPD